MPKINRDNIYDAKIIIEHFISDISTRNIFIDFICDAINFADTINKNNWNLNLDKNGRFLRFNTGHEYCVQLNKYEILILCDRKTILKINEIQNIPVIFRGWTGKKIIESRSIDNMPDLLTKTKNSIGCVLKFNYQIKNHINKFKSSNRDFIISAMNTTILPQMRRAHSRGAIDYVFSQFEDGKKYSLYDLSYILNKEAIQLDKATKLNHKDRLEELQKSSTKPKQIIVQQTVFLRNQFVVAEALSRANGYCEYCHKQAPFLRNMDNSPYLEVHHIIRLADGGDDTIENVVALCPNCHRKAHYG